jgi:hypothetical protein
MMKREFLDIYIYAWVPDYLYQMLTVASCRFANEHSNLPIMHLFCTLLIKTYKNVHINQIKNFDTSVYGVKLGIAHMHYAR